jgi:hypothetical protein
LTIAPVAACRIGTNQRLGVLELLLDTSHHSAAFHAAKSSNIQLGADLKPKTILNVDHTIATVAVALDCRIVTCASSGVLLEPQLANVYAELFLHVLSDMIALMFVC